MLEEPYNFNDKHYEIYSNIDINKNDFEYDKIKDYKCLKILRRRFIFICL